MSLDDLARRVRAGPAETDEAKRERREIEDLHLEVFGSPQGRRLLDIWLKATDGSVFAGAAADGQAALILAASRDGRNQFIRAIERRVESARRRNAGG